METTPTEVLQAAPDGERPVTRRNLLAHHDAHPYVLDVLLLRTFGPQVYGWDASTVWRELQLQYSTTVSDLNRNKIEAARTLHLAESPWRNWEVFEKIVCTLNNNIPRFDIMQVPTVAQLCNAVHIMQLVRDQPFTGDVPAYVAAVMLNAEVPYCPDQLRFAAPLLREDPPLADAYRGYKGRPLLERALDIQLAQLLVARRYVAMREAQRLAQLALLEEKQL